MKIRIYRRDGKPESVPDTVVDMTSPCSEDTVVIGDSLFGGVSTLEALALEGKHGVLSCSSKRPGWLFAQKLDKAVSNERR